MPQSVFKWLKSMPDLGFRLRRSVRSFALRLRELRMIAWGAMSTRHPIMAHIIPIRRCNLSCTYCNEYDDFSKPVPTETVIARINHLADLGTVIVTLSGGEPLLHPDLDDIIRAMRRRGLDRRHDHQWLPADAGSGAAPEPGGPRLDADLHRQRHARRRFEEEPQGARQEAASAGRACPVPRQHQFGGRRRDS